MVHVYVIIHFVLYVYNFQILQHVKIMIMKLLKPVRKIILLFLNIINVISFVLIIIVLNVKWILLVLKFAYNVLRQWSLEKMVLVNVIVLYANNVFKLIQMLYHVKILIMKKLKLVKITMNQMMKKLNVILFVFKIV